MLQWENSEIIIFFIAIVMENSDCIAVVMFCVCSAVNVIYVYGVCTNRLLHLHSSQVVLTMTMSI